MKKIINLYNKYLSKYITKELIIYGITGVATTLVNFIVYFLCTRVVGIEKNAANIISWFITIVFAYITNKLWVFQSKSHTIREEVDKIVKFFGARIFTLAIEVGGFYVLTTKLGIYDFITKAFLSIFVILFNYVFSKLFIFNRKEVNEKEGII